MMNTNPKRVFIFGAGASAAEGAPVQAKLMAKYKDLDKTGTLRSEVDRLLNALYPNMCEAAPPTFEEVFGLVHLALQNEQTFKSLSHDDLFDAPRILRQLIAKVLDIVLDDPQRRGAHHRLIENLIKHDESYADSQFVSFNYDILLDNALLMYRHARSRENPTLSYGIPVTGHSMNKYPWSLSQ